MASGLKKPLQSLVRGQLWKIPGAHIHILRIGKMSVDYKMLSDFALSGMRQTTTIKSMEVYLKTNAAKLTNANYGC